MNTQESFSLVAGLAAGVLLASWLSVGPALAQAQQQRNCVANLFQEMQRLGIAVNLPKDQTDFETDRGNAAKAIQNAIKANTLAAGTDTQFADSVEAIACHLADTARIPLTIPERNTRLTDAVAKLRNLFQRIANPVAGAEDLKDWLAKLRFAYWALQKDPNTNDYIWHFLRLELSAGGQDIDLVLLGPCLLYTSDAADE